MTELDCTMARPAKGASDLPPAVDTPSYGEALARLEALVQALEEADLPLETLLTRYEEGRRLVDLCQGRLAAAELRLRQLETTPHGDRLTP